MERLDFSTPPPLVTSELDQASPMRKALSGELPRSLGGSRSTAGSNHPSSPIISRRATAVKHQEKNFSLAMLPIGTVLSIIRARLPPRFNTFTILSLVYQTIITPTGSPAERYSFFWDAFSTLRRVMSRHVLDPPLCDKLESETLSQTAQLKVV